MFKKIIDFIQQTGYLGLFILLFFEGNPILGLFVPGQSILLVVGFFIALHVFNFYISFIVSFLASFIGDLANYWLGKKVGENFFKKYKFNKSFFYIKTKKFFHKNPIKTIFFGKYFSYTRAFIPFIAGKVDFDFKKFAIIDFIATFTLVSIFLLIGYFLGNLVLTDYDLIIKFLIIVILLVVAFYFTLKIFKTFYKKNYNILKRYAIFNYISLIFLIFSLIFVNIFAKLIDSIRIIEKSYYHLNISYVNLFILSFSFLTILFMVFKRKKLLYYLFLSIFVIFFYLFFVIFFIRKHYLIYPYLTIFIVEIVLFYLYVYLNEYISRKKNFIIFTLLNLLTILFFSLSQYNFVRIISSVILAGIYIELFAILSNFEIFKGIIIKEE